MGKFSFLPVICACLTLSTLVDAQTQKLQRYNVDPSTVTVSGISAGAAMATQFHFAHSNDVFGVGMVAGLPYHCTSTGLVGAELCMNSPGLTNVNALTAQANSYAATNQIDPTSNIQGDRVFIFQGTADTTVFPGNGVNIQTMYSNFGAQIRTEFTIAAAHGFPTNNYGAACGTSSPQTYYINNCSYTGAFHILNYMYSDSLIQPVGGEAIVNNLITFDQTEFLTQTPNSMDTTGFVYVPTSCRNGVLCKLHIVYHGCLQNSGNVGQAFVLKAGYLDVAEINNIIILFPQATANILLLNPQACFDWWGYINANFATKQGTQIIATYSMMSRILRG